MIGDHVYQMLHMFGAPLFLTMLGRVVAPTFLFLAAESFQHTRSKGKYLLRLLIGFWFMGLGNLFISREFYLEDVALINNIFGTLFLSVLYMWLVDGIVREWKQRRLGRALLHAGGLAVPFLLGSFAIMVAPMNMTLFHVLYLVIPSPLTVEGGYWFMFMGLGFYLLRKNPLLQTLPLFGLGLMIFVISGGSSLQWMMIFAVVPMLLYNGAPGAKTAFSKYFFYVIYPVHIYILYFISYFLH